jgi:hypothetical protein
MVIRPSRSTATARLGHRAQPVLPKPCGGTDGSAPWSRRPALPHRRLEHGSPGSRRPGRGSSRAHSLCADDRAGRMRLVQGDRAGRTRSAQPIGEVACASSRAIGQVACAPSRRPSTRSLAGFLGQVAHAVNGMGVARPDQSAAVRRIVASGAFAQRHERRSSGSVRGRGRDRRVGALAQRRGLRLVRISLRPCAGSARRRASAVARALRRRDQSAVVRRIVASARFGTSGSSRVPSPGPVIG